MKKMGETGGEGCLKGEGLVYQALPSPSLFIEGKGEGVKPSPLLQVMGGGQEGGVLPPQGT